MSSRRLQDVLIKTNIFALLIRLQKTSSSRPTYSSWSHVFKASSRRLQDVLKTSSRRPQDSSRRPQDVLKTFQDVLSSSSVFGNTISRRLRDVLKTFLRCTAKTIIYRRVAQVTLPKNLWSLCKIPKSDKNFSSFCFSLYYTFQWLHLIEAHLEHG